MSHGRPLRPAPPIFRPRFTVMLIYVAGFFLLYSLVLVLPDLAPIFRSDLPGPEQQELAKQTAHAAASRPKLLTAFVAAVLTVGAGAYTRKLPGLGS